MASRTDKAQVSNREARRDEIGEQLLQTVEKMIADGDSFADIAVRRMVREAQISRSSFYLHFVDKSDLVRSWLQEVPRRSEEAVDAWLSRGADMEFDDLRCVLAEIFSRYRPHATIMAAVHDSASYDAAIRDEVRSMMGIQIDAMELHIVRGQAGGWIDPDLPPRETATWIVWMAERGQHQLLVVRSEIEFSRRLDALAELVWNALYAFAPARRNCSVCHHDEACRSPQE